MYASRISHTIFPVWRQLSSRGSKPAGSHINSLSLQLNSDRKLVEYVSLPPIERLQRTL